MSKSVVVIDTPEDCMLCEFWNSDTGECYASGVENTLIVGYEDNKPDECPLVELPDENPSNPELKPGVYYSESAYEVYKNGWNDLRGKLEK